MSNTELENAVTVDETEVFTCENCGAVTPGDQSYYVGSQRVCNSCYENETAVCVNCDSLVMRDDLYEDGEEPLCQNCYDNYYTHCTHCDRLIRCTDALSRDYDYYCDSCYVDYVNNSVHEYSYKPTPIFYGEIKKGSNPRYFGVELEIDDGGRDNDNANELNAVTNTDKELIYIKSDGSLDDGMEIVTHPMTLDFHKNNMPWQLITKTALDLGYLSHKTDTCGLHVHVNRNTFTENYDIQEDCIGRVLFFVERFWEELLVFSRRTEFQVRRWAARYGYKDKPGEILEHAKKGASGRYTCVNIMNRDTIEFRIFRGTLKYNTIIATLQMINAICNVAFSMSDSEIGKLSWPEFVSGLTEPELIQYLKERRIYVNETVSCEEDD